MFTSLNKTFKKQALHYLYVSLALLFVIIIYEQFSHGVTSTYMRVSILIPLIGGSLLSLVTPQIKAPSRLESNIWQMSLATLTIGLFLHGIFEIYGSVEPLVYTYYYVAGISAILTIALYIRTLTKPIT